MRVRKSTIRKTVKALNRSKDPLKSIARAASKACSKKDVKYAASLTKKAIRKITRSK
jgi:hypothetical protein